MWPRSPETESILHCIFLDCAAEGGSAGTFGAGAVGTWLLVIAVCGSKPQAGSGQEGYSDGHLDPAPVEAGEGTRTLRRGSPPLLPPRQNI